ncbi:cytoplasmic protein [Boletus reticuloceps]|uniref:Cytoplasmic protein n=1 Tax=Boletus reticuloceps TaxID=495285 RepID=A0A8I2YGS1_9AGAM|nr:cytoplasmic protein [Boletus reticuloceps]
MDIYSISFTHPRRSRHLHSPSSSLDAHDHRLPPHIQHLPDNFPSTLSLPSAQPSPPNQADSETVEKLAVFARGQHKVQLSYLLSDGGRNWNFFISGAYQHVMPARGLLLKDSPVQHRTAIKVPRSDILDSPSSKPTLKPDVRRKLDEIASLTYAHIAVVNSPLSLSSRTPPDGISTSAGWTGLETERVCELVVTGQGDATELARVRLLVMLDELSGLHAEPCEIDQKLHAIIAGRKRHVLQSIQEETATNIYYPSPLQGLVGPDLVSSPVGTNGNPPSGQSRASQHQQAHNPNVIWITGEFFGVQRARDMLFQLSANKSKSVISRDTVIVPRKLDWMVLDRAEDLKSIMSDNATFIQFPPIGSSTSLITVYGDHRVNVQRTIRGIMQLACQYYVASFWLLPIQFNVLLPPATLNTTQVTALLKQISMATGAEVVFKSMCFEMHGLEYEVRAAVGMILDLDLVKAFHHEIRFQVELANEHREFISGKKNGKINKIMQSASVKIKFETFNDHNFLIDLSGSDASILTGLTLLQEELPAEISFHVPEAYHKRIIGIGGRNIQRIMKKYGVYVKFSNAEEFAALGGYNDNEDNVVARTPSKNAINLDNLKQSVMEIVNPKDKDYVNETLSIPRRYHRTLLGEKAIFIHDIESKTNSRVRFPDKETASDVVTIFGPESQVQIAAAMLLEHVPFEADMPVPPSLDLPMVCASPEFVAFVERVKREFQVSIAPNLKPPAPIHSTNGSSTSLDHPSTSLPQTAQLQSQGEYSFKFQCQRSNSDFLLAAREMLEQFLLNHNVRVYPSPTAHTHKRGDSFAEAFPHFDSKVLSTARRHESVELTRSSEILGDRRLRLANSSPDVKALFNAPAYIYDLEDHEDSQSAYGPSGTGLDYWTPLPPIGSGIASRTRNTEDALKRGSDSLLESKIKEQISKPRSLQNRAQSLDLTYSLSRITEGSRLQPPESPTTSTGGGTGGNSSPTSVTAPSFPSVYGPRSLAVTGSSAQRSARVMDEEVVDEVSRVMSNLGL